MKYFIYFNSLEWKKNGIDYLRKLKQDYSNLSIIGEEFDDQSIDKIKKIGFNYIELIKFYNDSRDIINIIAKNSLKEDFCVFMDYQNPKILQENDFVNCLENDLQSRLFYLISFVTNLYQRAKIFKLLKNRSQFASLSFLAAKGDFWISLNEFQTFLNDKDILEKKCDVDLILNLYLSLNSSILLNYLV